MEKGTATVSADSAAIRAAMLEEIRRELATMTERERVQLLLKLKKDFLKEVNRRSGCVLFATEPT